MTKSMLDAAAKALAQMFTPALRAVLLKAVGLALILIVIVGIVLQRFLSALAEHGATWAEQSSGFAPHAAWQALAWVLSIMATRREVSTTASSDTVPNGETSAGPHVTP